MRSIFSETDLEVMARLKAGLLLASVGRVQDALAELHRALGGAVLLGDRHAEFLAHHHLWKTFLKLGEHDHARLEFEAASHFLRYVDEVSPETEEVRNTMKGEHNESVSGESLRPRTR